MTGVCAIVLLQSASKSVVDVFQQRFDARGAIGHVLSDQRSQHQALSALMCIQQPDITFGHSSEKQLRSVYTEVEQG